MKKLIALLCALAMTLAATVLAESPLDSFPFANTPEPDFTTPEPDAGTPTPSPLVPSPRTDNAGAQTFSLEVDGRTVPLAFDASPQYSSVQGGLVQASYYGYDTDGVTMYELYIIFPDTAREGMVITPQYSALTGQESSVVLIESDNDHETYYFSSLMDGIVYPVGSDYAITIDSMQSDGGVVTYSGRLSASLIALNMSSGEVESTFTIPETPFSFTIGGSDDPQRHADPLSTEVPPDMRKV